MFRLLSQILHILPLSDSGKEALKRAIYTRFGSWFAGSDNYALWLLQQEKLKRSPPVPPPVEPSEDDWRGIFDRRAGPEPEVLWRGSPYIVVPVYSGRAETLACLYSVLRADPWSEVVVIDDCIPEAALAGRLSELADAGLIRLERNERNQGFARSVNRGMALYPARDVVLLNSDTEVFGDWLLRLNRQAHRASDVGTVTPLSNNAEICSYPHWFEDNPMQLEVSYEELDELARRSNEDAYVETPTAVGFCMYIKRECLEEVGPFDLAFAEGYGEENDFCMRARERGWHHRIAGDIFVRHVGAVSFGRSSIRRRKKALALLHERFPDYSKEIDEYKSRDPLKEIRTRLDVARLAAAGKHRNARAGPILFVVHNWGGGVEQHIAFMAAALEAEGVDAYVLRPAEDDTRAAAISGVHGSLETPSLQHLSLGGDQVDLVSVLRQLKVGHIHIHHTAGFDQVGITALHRLAESLNCRYDLTLHDFGSFCPRLHLSYEDGKYCGEPDIDGCEQCVAEFGSPFGVVSVSDWRARWRVAMNGARRVYCPTRDTAERARKHFPEAHYTVIPHPEEVQAPAPHAQQRQAGRPLRIAVPGAIGAQKGFWLLIECARDTRARGLPLEFCVVGYTVNRKEALAAGIEVTGAYDPEDADAALSRSGANVAMLPSLSPETFSFVLSSAFRIQMFPVVFDLGAMAERILDAGWGEILPCSMMNDPQGINDYLLNLVVPRVPADFDARSSAGYPTGMVRDYYEGFAP